MAKANFKNVISFVQGTIVDKRGRATSRIIKVDRRNSGLATTPSGSFVRVTFNQSTGLWGY